MFSTNSASRAMCCLGPFFVQFTVLRNAVIGQLESSASKSIINSLRDEVKAAASVAVCLCFCLLRAVTNLPALGHTLADSSRLGFRDWPGIGGLGDGSQRCGHFASGCQSEASHWSVQADIRGPEKRMVSGMCEIQFQTEHLPPGPALCSAGPRKVIIRTTWPGDIP